MKFFVKTFGCAQNQADSERIRAFYRTKNYQETRDINKADLVIINSCMIRESAENRVYGLINNLKKKKIVVTGCVVTGLGKKKLEAKLGKKIKLIASSDFGFGIKPLRDKGGAALVPISNGCDNFCSYCIVPYARGREKSRKSEKIIKEVEQIIKDGFNEIVLIGQNVNSYGKDINTSFPVLLDKIAKTGIGKISFVSSNPWDFSDQLIAVISKHKNIDRLIHLPLQSGDDEILRRMNRKYTAKDYMALIDRIKKSIPEVQFSTDILIGFPGEDEKAFKNTIKMCKKVKFVKAYINKYSPRPGTVASKLYQDDVPQDVKRKRWMILEELINKQS